MPDLYDRTHLFYYRDGEKTDKEVLMVEFWDEIENRPKINPWGEVRSAIKHDEYRLSSEYITENDDALFNRWIRASIELLCYADAKKTNETVAYSDIKEKIQKWIRAWEESFKNEEKVAERTTFCNQLIEGLYKYRLISIRGAENIRSNIERYYSIPSKTRDFVSVLCILTDSFPEVLFTEGSTWYEKLGNDMNDVIILRAGDHYSVGPAECTNLTPATLVNNSPQNVFNLILHGGKNYEIKIPPCGMLRVFFSNSDKSHITMIRSNISCYDPNRAIVQSRKSDPNNVGNYLCKLSYIDVLKKKPVDFCNMKNFRDFSADRLGGAKILTDMALFSTGEVNPILSVKNNDKLPIACFTSGNQTAMLFADGRLEGKWCGNEQKREGVVSVCTDAERGILYSTKDTAYDCRLNTEKKMNVIEYNEVMLQSFVGEHYESVLTQFNEIYINTEGEINIRQL